MIKNDAELRQTFEQLERMQRALATLRDGVLPGSRWIGRRGRLHGRGWTEAWPLRLGG
jgi:hypothetical protein